MVTAESSEAVTEVLRANAMFYRAFTEGNFEAMRHLWAETAPISCQHPLALTLVGRDAVLRSFRQILEAAPPFALRCEDPVVHLLGNVALVACYEGSGDKPAHLVATNMFVREVDGWRMVHHQAGPLGRAQPRPSSAILN